MLNSKTNLPNFKNVRKKLLNEHYFVLKRFHSPPELCNF